MAMERKTFEIDEIEQLLRQASEREVPAGLQKRIMDDIPAIRPRRTFLEKAGRWWQRTSVPRFSSLKLAAVLGMAVAAFWLGTVFEGRNQARLAAPQLQIAELAPFAGSARANYLVGRGLLEAGEKHLALEFIHRAVLLEPRSAEYGHWQGMAYWQIGDRERERQSYLKSIARQPDYIPALLNLGHNLLESGAYREALDQYEKVLRINPSEQTALYNRALGYGQLGDQARQQRAFSQYLDQYRSDKWAYRAVDHLQRLGVFDYRIFLIGNRKIAINQQILLDPAHPARRLELERLAGWLRKAPAGELHLIVFYQDDKDRGKTIAEELRQQLHAIMGTQAAMPIRVSWFDEPESMRTAEGTERKLTQGLLLFTQPLITQGGKV